MDLEFFKKITTDMYDNGVEEIGLFYLGESLMNPNLTINACRFLKKELGMPYVFLTTNGSLASPAVLERLMAAGLDSLKFSINAADHEQFKEVMGVKPKLYSQALEAIEDAWEIRLKGGYDTKIYASSIMYDGEQQEKMESLVKKYVKPFVDEHYWLPLYSMGSVATQREEELGYRPTAGNQGRIGGLVKPLPCWSAFTEGHVRSDGVVSLCCFDADGRFQVGNLHEDDWMTIWHNDKFTKIREAHLKEDLTGTVCEECVAY
jgi:MoaA/NifB/PqqE/SkfB family radical SAM enzyme